jgi:hypothetical protein
MINTGVKIGLYIETSVKKTSLIRATSNYFFYVHEAVHHEYMSVIVQHDDTIYSFIYICKLLYMFRVLSPSINRSS